MDLNFELTTAPINQLVDQLPNKSVTTYMLQALDFVVPGEWENITNFNQMITVVTGETDPKRVKAIAKQAAQIYNNSDNGFQKAVWLYEKVDLSDKLIAATVLGNKIGEQIDFLSFLQDYTPKPDVVQSIDLALKLSVEMVNYTLLNGLPRDGFKQFADSLQSYSGTNLMRIATLICIDGIIPLGPDFLGLVNSKLDEAPINQIETNPIYEKIKGLIPGNDSTEKLGFVKETILNIQGWVNEFVAKHNLSSELILSHLKKAIQISDDKTDYLAAGLDATTNYFTHTGIQTVARALILQAEKETAKNIITESRSIISNSNSRTAPVSQAEMIRTFASWVEEFNLPYSIQTTEDGYQFINVTFGSALVQLFPGENEALSTPYLDVEGIVVSDVQEMSKKTALTLLKMNHETSMGGYTYYEDAREIHYFCRLLAPILTKETLAMAINDVGYTSDTMDEDIARATGGKRIIDSVGKLARRVDDLTHHYIEGNKSKKTLWKDLEKYLEQLGLDYDEDDESYILTFGSTEVYLELYKDADLDIPVLEIYATLAEYAGKIPRETAVHMLIAGANVGLGYFCYEAKEDYIYLSYVIPGDLFSASILEEVATKIGQYGDYYDDFIAKETGGERASDL